MNNGLIIGDAIGSGLRTYQQLQNIDANKQTMGLRDEQAKMQREQHAAQMEAIKEEKIIRGMKVDEIKGDQLRKVNEAFAWSMYNAQGMPDEYKKLIAAHPNLDAQRLMSDEAGNALSTIDAIAAGKIHFSSTEAAEAFNFLNPEISLGATENRKVKTSRLYPGGSPSTLRVGLRVEGDPKERPLTVHRSSRDDDPVREVSVDEQIQKAMIMKSYREMLMSDQGRQWFIKTHLPQLNQQVSAKDQSAIEYNKSRANYYNTKASKVRDESDSGGAGKLPAKAQMVNFYKAMGYDDDDAIAMANDSAGSPQKFVTDYSKMLLETSRDGNGDPTMTTDQAFEKSLEVYNASFRRKPANGSELAVREEKRGATPALITRPGGTAQAPTAAVEFLKKNPDQAENFKAKYGYLPEGF